jgi:hypothetical protein
MAAPVGVAVASVLGCVAISALNPTDPNNLLPTCPTKALLGIDCPGCGSLRMIYSLTRGDLGAALRYNAVGLVALGLLVWSWVAWTLGRWRGRRVRSWADLRRAPSVTLVVVVVWAVVRNLPFRPFELLWV